MPVQLSPCWASASGMPCASPSPVTSTRCMPTAGCRSGAARLLGAAAGGSGRRIPLTNGCRPFPSLGALVLAGVFAVNGGCVLTRSNPLASNAVPSSLELAPGDKDPSARVTTVKSVQGGRALDDCEPQEVGSVWRWEPGLPNDHNHIPRPLRPLSLPSTSCSFVPTRASLLVRLFPLIVPALQGNAPAGLPAGPQEASSECRD